ncbi:hypothetical protein HORIV_01940 [Vreelandella olivaria]|uniref:Uncharacterized protein n=1 Tax=Vreelandella olivaria TaxID=390919 RepID=A0ABM7GBI9_9GAMM|nr:hypothetical protein HORIV_01940 [Halomonas olivaria]
MVAIQVLAQRHTVGQLLAFKGFGGLLVKAQNVAQQAVKEGLSKLRRWANSEPKVCPLYSKSRAVSCTEKLISVACEATPRVAIKR